MVNNTLIINETKNEILAKKVLICDTIFKKMKGLMFKKISEDEACILKFNNENNFYIHGFFCPQTLQLICVKDNNVVELHTLKPYRIIKIKEKVDSIIEVLPKNVNIGDRITNKVK